jgi:pyruvate dehydrogenase E2 component (dihydrolipoamide acetyltransferase)
MAISVVMPALELTQESGKLLAWRKKEGETVVKGEPLLEVETDKAVVEIEAPGDGILAGIKAREGAVVPVGQTIAWIVAAGEQVPAEAAPIAPGNKALTGPPLPPATAAPTPQTPERPAGPGLRISPKARRLAKEHGVDISRLRGSGPEGEILAEDVLAVVESKAEPAANTAPAVSDLEPLSTVGRLMAERTTQSWTSVPHFFVARDVDAGALIEAREILVPAIEQSRGVKLTHTDLLLALVARVLLQHPRLNGSWTPQGIRLHPDANVALAIAVKDAVVAPVIHNAHKTDLAEIAAQRRDLSERARAGRLRPADITGATFTISNLGMYHVDAFTAIISPPQAAILAVGSIADRVVAVDGRPGVRPMMTITLACDHRVVDGAGAAAFLNDLAEAIGDPEKWLQ